jgi:elongation factor Ts
MNITAALVNELRQKTGAGMMDCKKALTETAGNLENAVDWLRKKGLASAAKKAGRIAAEGLVAAATRANKGVVLELNSETDFVAKNEKFQTLASSLASDFLDAHSSDAEHFKKEKSTLSGKSIEEEVAEHIAVIGENIILRRAAKLEVKEGAVVNYIHNAITPSLGKIGVVIALESSIDPSKLITLGKQLAMHIAAAKPEALNVEDLDSSLVEREKALHIEQAATSGKPENVIAKMVEGKMQKFYEQVVLLHQLFIIDGKTKIADLLENFGKENGGKVAIKAYVKYVLGEGIEKEETNLAEEIAAMNAR